MDLPDLVLPIIRPEVRHAFHLFVIRTDNRDVLAKCLSDAGVQTGIHYPESLPKLRAYDYLGQADEIMLANSQSEKLLSLPIGEHLSKKDVEYVINTIRKYVTRD